MQDYSVPFHPERPRLTRKIEAGQADNSPSTILIFPRSRRFLWKRNAFLRNFSPRSLAPSSEQDRKYPTPIKYTDRDICLCEESFPSSIKPMMTRRLHVTPGIDRQRDHRETKRISETAGKRSSLHIPPAPRFSSEFLRRTVGGKSSSSRSLFLRDSVAVKRQIIEQSSTPSSGLNNLSVASPGSPQFLSRLMAIGKDWV